MCVVEKDNYKSDKIAPFSFTLVNQIFKHVVFVELLLSHFGLRLMGMGMEIGMILNHK